MAKAATNGIQIEYDTFGKPGEPPLLLIAAMACQLIQWDEALCEQLARRGHYVIRFDNRDTGLSTRLVEGGIPDLGSVSVPTLVIHGDDDPLVPVEGGRETAEAIPGAELIIIEGMGHDLPHYGNGAWRQIVDEIVNHTQKIST